MNKKSKSGLSFMLAATMSLSVLPMQGVSAVDYEEEIIEDVDYGYGYTIPIMQGTTTSSDISDVAMKAALTKVKQRIKIPEELTEFSYRSYTNDNTTQYNFTWTTPNGTEDYSSLHVTIVGDIITNYNMYSNSKNNYNYSQPKFAKLTDSNLLSKAKASLKTINPTISAKCNITSHGVSLYGNTASFSIDRKYDGINVSNNYGNISLDKDTGELTSFYISWWDNASFKNKSNAISTEQLQASYQALNTFTPYYRIYEDSVTGKRTAKIVYTPSFYDDIDAFTGKLSTMYEDQKKDRATTDVMLDSAPSADYDVVDDEMVEEEMDTGAGGTKKVTFTEAEKKAITANEKLLTQDKVMSILKKDKYLNLTDNYTTTSASLYYQESYSVAEESKYYWDFNFKNEDTKTIKNASVRVDAETGKIIYFYKNSYNNYNYADSKTKEEVKPVLDVNKAQSIAAGAMKYYLPDIYKKYKADMSNEREITYWGEDNKYYDTSRTFFFDRYQNDIEVTGNSININVNSDGEVMSFSYSHTDKVTFEKAENLLAEKELYKKLFAQKEFEMRYNGFITKAGKVKTYLNYNMNGYTLNAKTGKLCDYYGNDIVSHDDVTIVYNDIKGIKAEKAINEFKRHGVMLESINDKFEPNKVITEQEFSLLVQSVFNNYEVYRAYVQANSKDGKLVSDKNLTNSAACKYFIKAINAEDYAKLKGIFTTPYSDVSASRSDIGYIAIAYAKGAITVDSTGKFNPDKAMTRAEAILMLYNYVSKL